MIQELLPDSLLLFKKGFSSLRLASSFPTSSQLVEGVPFYRVINLFTGLLFLFFPLPSSFFLLTSLFYSSSSVQTSNKTTFFLFRPFFASRNSSGNCHNNKIIFEIDKNKNTIGSESISEIVCHFFCSLKLENATTTTTTGRLSVSKTFKQNEKKISTNNGQATILL